MRQALLAALLFPFVTPAAQSQPASTSKLMPASGQSASPAATSLASAQGDDIQLLRASILQLQDRLDRLSPPSEEKLGTTGPLTFDFLCMPAESSKVNPSSANVFFGPEPGPLCKTDEATHCCKNDGAAAWPLNASWDNGLLFTSRDETFRIHVGGNFQFDQGWNSANQTVENGPGGTGVFQDGAVFRYGRIRIDGTIYQHFDWVAEYDFANSVQNDTAGGTPIGSPSFTNVWFGVNDLPLIGTIRAGWMDEPVGFVHAGSIRWLNFMEKAPGVGALSLTSPGILFRNAGPDERVTWALGLFHAQNDNFGFGIGNGEYAYTGRLTCLPWYADEGLELLHLGVGATHRHLSDGQIDLRGRPSVRTMPGVLVPALAETGTIVGTTLDGIDGELAGVYGPWTLQSEYYCSFIHDAIFPNQPPPQGKQLGTLFYQGTYVELLYFLTGESQPYNRRDAIFERVVPRRNFDIWGEERGWGAWQVGIRYGYVDLQSKGVNGATLNDIVLGLNWFLNPNAKFQWNVAIDHRESTPPGSSGWTYILGSRIALDY
jgi:phosphate-selective porin OprO/OprP